MPTIPCQELERRSKITKDLESGSLSFDRWKIHCDPHFRSRQAFITKLTRGEIKVEAGV